MKSLTSLIAANTKSFFRDRMGMFWTFAFPVFFVLIFGMVFSGTGDVHYSIGVVLEDGSQGAHQISDAFRQVDVLTVQEGDRENRDERAESRPPQRCGVIPSTMMAQHGKRADHQFGGLLDPLKHPFSDCVSILDKVVQHIDREMTKRPVMLGLESNSIQTQQMKQIDYILPVFWRWR